jgi:hypothetical protein
MHHPAHIDGCTVVVLRQERWGFRVLGSGRLTHDGESLTLVDSDVCRPFSDAERDSLLPVGPGNRIPQCRGFDFFLLAEADA